MRIFKYSTFRQWAKIEGLTDHSLKKATKEIVNGLFDANLGNGLYKKRIARRNQGKRCGFRTIIAFKQSHRTVFMYGFSKNQRDNINYREEMVFKKLAKYYLELPESKLDILILNEELIEVI